MICCWITLFYFSDVGSSSSNDDDDEDETLDLELV